MTGVRFEEIDSSSGIRITDEARQERTELRFDEPGGRTPTDTNEFPFPVSDAIEISISGFELTPFSTTYLRDSVGRPFHSFPPGETQELPDYDYCLELCTPVKTYILFSGRGTVSVTKERIEVSFTNSTTVKIGGRSSRTEPQYTITTPVEPEAIMTALSFLGTGIDTTSPSRSYATTRGYPPVLELGSNLSIPDDVASRESRVKIELPPKYEYIFPAASLIYYSGATVEPGDAPRLCVDDRTVRELSRKNYHEDVERVLRRVFFLDCLTRTVGHYPFETQSYRHLVDDLPFEIGDLYEADLGTRIQSYLSVPFELLEPELPTWSVTAHVEADGENVPFLPHLAYQLAFVRTGSYDRVSGTSARKKSMKTFMAHHDSGATRIVEEVFDSEASFVELPSATSTDVDTWAGTDIPLQANELLLDGFETRLQRTSMDEAAITVSIVCNESWMEGEAAVSRERYDDRADLPFDVDVHQYLDRNELRDVLESDVDFFHYVGHANKNGLKCRDGYFDVDSVSGVGADMFVLNACQSYRPGVDMVRNGCIGGIVTLSDVTDTEATTVGRTIARLLNLGFPLRNALGIARRRSIIGGQYLAIGDDSAAMVQAESGTPYECFVAYAEDGFELTLRTYPTNRFHLGTLFRPNIDEADGFYLAGKPIGPYRLSREQLVTFLELENAPVEFEDDFRWAFDLATELG